MRKLTVALVALAVFEAFAGWSPAPVSITTSWGEKVTPENALREYPRPQFVRALPWQNLNGLWDYKVVKIANIAEFEMLAEEAKGTQKFDGKILVPFPIESSLSGVGRMLESKEMLWYSRKFEVSPEKGFRTLLNFEAVDFRAQVFVNGVEVTDVPHEGMSDPFSLDITEFVKSGENLLQVCVWDPTQEFVGSNGKQRFSPSGCFYTRMSGIWQTVWLETVPEEYILDYRVSTDLDAGEVRFDVETSRCKRAPVEIEILFDGKTVAKGKGGDAIKLPAPLRLWSPETPNLYTVKFVWGEDRVDSYFAMRKIELKKDVNGVLRFYLNGKAVFLQGTLDQGWWPESLLTPPSEEAMRAEIKFLKDAGFNMMRKHIKVEPRRYYALCDKMGIMVLQDMPSGLGDIVQRYGFYRHELKRMIDHLVNVPSIVMWVPYNEGWGQPGARYSLDTLAWVKRYDPSRLVDGASGWHDYENWCIINLKKGITHARDMHKYPGPNMFPTDDFRASFLGEFGGIGYTVTGHVWNVKSKGWGYVSDNDLDKSFERYSGIMEGLAMLAANGLAGSVYTQTTDVELEVNGLLTYDRKVCKYPVEKLRELHEAVYAAADSAANSKCTEIVIVPAMDAASDAWRYTFDTPPQGWTAPEFDDSAWKKSAAGFGNTQISKENKKAKVNTLWETQDIYLRKRFVFDGKAENINLVWAELFHDDDCEIYLNGELILSRKGFTRSHDDINVKRKVFLKAIKEGENVLSAHCRQFQHGQYFDVGLKATSK